MHLARRARWAVALAVALTLALVVSAGACSSGGSSDVSSRSGVTDVDETRTSRGGEDRGGEDRGGEEVATGRSSTSATATSSTTTTTTTTAPPTTAAPTTTAVPATAVPAPPTTTPPPPPPTTSPPPPPSGPRHGTRNTGCEQFMHQQINAARARAGRPGLTFDSVIQYIAVDWSDEMARTQTLRHNPDYGDQILRHRDYRTAGENVGRGYEQESLFQAFMDSPGHRANIESGAYSHVTVGCLTDGGGQLWVTQNFWGG